MFYGNTDVTATLSNNTGFMATAKYKVRALTVYGGYAWIRQANPSDDYLNGFTTIGGWNVPATITGNTLFPTKWTNYTNYNIPRIAPFFWVGAKYAITPQIDVTGAFYWLQQANYAGTTATCAATTTHLRPAKRKQIQLYALNSGKCAGQTDFISAPHRLSAAQAPRPLCRHNDLERVWRLGERLSGGADGQPDRRPAGQVLSSHNRGLAGGDREPATPFRSGTGVLHRTPEFELSAADRAQFRERRGRA